MFLVYRYLDMFLKHNMKLWPRVPIKKSSLFWKPENSDPLLFVFYFLSYEKIVGGVEGDLKFTTMENILLQDKLEPCGTARDIYLIWLNLTGGDLIRQRVTAPDKHARNMGATRIQYKCDVET